MDTKERTNQLIADINFKVISIICKELKINLGDIIDKHKTSASFILAAIRKIVGDCEPKDETEPDEKTGE